MRPREKTAGTLACDMYARAIHVRIRAGEVDVFNTQAECGFVPQWVRIERNRIGTSGSATSGRSAITISPGSAITQVGGPHRVQGARLGGENHPAVERADAQRTEAVRVAHGEELSAT